ncbi:TetR/AcrR family transcriptional regulator [Streptomonospora litoralis]|uniref:DNA-binding transcriptional repressor FabR n=1 Tax=Streptomonospora litoralis TaxID=2498135 RepID=A0A4P6Q9Z8_9ACTN|nr:TetR/AcrR family transcriptional regulator [Streptomonospora litoralis]QBI56511.1 DNA-binding transcriptional repressor FabR [Streptomonospora litoralis]
MDRPSPVEDSLRERKRRRARESIVEAAFELFTEHGFEGVTVADIAERAEVGRATFFRHFGDKQEVVFGDDPDIETAVAEEARRLPAPDPIGDSLPDALAYLRRFAALLVARMTENPAAYRLHERIVAETPELRARSLLKQRRYAEAMTTLLVERGADVRTARLAAETALACYYAGHATAGGDPARLAADVDAAFARLV